jgi:hypothetical protein
MWIYDGDQWIEERGKEPVKKTDPTHLPEELYQPELQVIEIVPRPRTTTVPPLPMP